MKHLLTVLSLLLVLAGCSPAGRQAAQATRSRPAAAPAARATQSYQVRSKFLDNGPNLRIYVLFDPVKTLSEAELQQQLTVKYQLLPDYGSRQELAAAAITPEPGRNMALMPGGQVMLWFEVPKPAASRQIYTGVVLTTLTIKGREPLEYDTPVRFRSPRMGDHYAIFDAEGRFPLLHNYAAVGQQVQLRSLTGRDTTFRLFHYNFNFDPALPPMSTARPTARRMYVDSAYSVQSNQPILLKNRGLYFFVKDTVQSPGVGFMAVTDRYPRYTQPADLRAPVVYMSTSQEVNDLYRDGNPKTALDRYWLSLSGGNTGTARRNIAAYYRRVEEANRQFTGYKEGWKTDRGMVYMVMGPPDRVTRSKDREVWLYIRPSSRYREVNFTFLRRTNLFIEDHYELSRFTEFEPIWYPALEAWRRGDIQ